MRFMVMVKATKDSEARAGQGFSEASSIIDEAEACHLSRRRVVDLLDRVLACVWPAGLRL
jgi:hypothetical protein